MAFIVAKKDGSWEARESVRTESGPRSKTLASFREISPEVIRQITDRASKPVDIDDLRRRAARAGVPTATEVDRLAARTAREIALAGRPSRNYSILLADALREESKLPHHLDRMKLWAGATLAERADVLVDLLRASGAFPPIDRERDRQRPRFPRINSNR
jgi:hypothetical protein